MIEPTESEAQGRARPLLRRDDRDPRRDPRRSSAARPTATDNPLKHAPHTADRAAGRLDRTPTPREQAAFPVPALRERQVLAAGRPRRQRLRRPQPGLRLPADRELSRRRRLGLWPRRVFRLLAGPACQATGAVAGRSAGERVCAPLLHFSPGSPPRRCRSPAGTSGGRPGASPAIATDRPWRCPGLSSAWHAPDRRRRRPRSGERRRPAR